MISVSPTNRGSVEETLGSEFLKELHRYLGLDPDTPKQHQTVNVPLLVREAVGVIEKHQLSLILPGDVTLLLPYRTLCENKIEIPLGKPHETPVVTLETEPGITSTLTPTIYQPAFPAYLFFSNEDIPDAPTEDVGNPLKITYRTGFQSSEQVPSEVFAAIKVYAFHSLKRKEDGRSDELPKAFWTFVNTGYQVTRQIDWMLT